MPAMAMQRHHSAGEVSLPYERIMNLKKDHTMKKKAYMTPETLCCDLKTEGLMGDHTEILQTSPGASALGPGQGGDLEDDDEIAAKPFPGFTGWED